MLLRQCKKVLCLFFPPRATGRVCFLMRVGESEEGGRTGEQQEHGGGDLECMVNQDKRNLSGMFFGIAVPNRRL